MSLRFPKKTERLAGNPYYSRDHITREDYAMEEALEARKEKKRIFTKAAGNEQNETLQPKN